MDQRKEIYKDKEIEYDMPATTQKYSSGGGEVHVEIDHEDLHVVRMEDGTYGTHLLPFQNYGSIEQLTKEVIDNDEKDSKTVGDVLNYRELKYAYAR